MTHRTGISGLICVLLLALTGWYGCSGSGNTGHETVDNPQAMAADGTGTVAGTETVGTETLDDGDFEILAVGPELTRAEERGLMIFRHYCAHCHGFTGQGDGQNSYGLETPPRDLSSVEMDSRTDEELCLLITGGGAAHGLSILMPPWGRTLEPHRIADLVKMIRILPDLEGMEEDDEEGLDDDDMGDFSL